MTENVPHTTTTFTAGTEPCALEQLAGSVYQSIHFERFHNIYDNWFQHLSCTTATTTTTTITTTITHSFSLDLILVKSLNCYLPNKRGYFDSLSKSQRAGISLLRVVYTVYSHGRGGAKDRTSRGQHTIPHSIVLHTRPLEVINQPTNKSNLQMI